MQILFLIVAIAITVAFSRGLAWLTMTLCPAHPIWMGLLFAVVGVAIILAWAYWSFGHCKGSMDEAGGVFYGAIPLAFLWILASIGSAWW